MAENQDTLLLDTQLLLWWAATPERLPILLRTQLEAGSQPVSFSVASLWEVAIKTSLGRSDFQVDASALRQGLLHECFTELTVRAAHVLAVQPLPWIHRDPFDRLLVAQAAVEGFTLLTADQTMAAYGAHVRLINPRSGL